MAALTSSVVTRPSSFLCSVPSLPSFSRSSWSSLDGPGVEAREDAMEPRADTWPDTGRDSGLELAADTGLCDGAGCYVTELVMTETV